MGEPGREFDPLVVDLRPFHGFGTAPIPDERDASLDRFVGALLDEAVVERPVDVTQQAQQVLRVYAERCATRAVRDHRPDLISCGLVALLLGGLADGIREALLPMPLLEDACRRLGLSATVVFERVAERLPWPTGELADWLRRRPQDRSLASMAFAAAGEGPDFRYVWKG